MWVVRNMNQRVDFTVILMQCNIIVIRVNKVRNIIVTIMNILIPDLVFSLYSHASSFY